MTEIKRNSDWYYANLDSLLPKYNGKYIGISDCSVVGIFNTFSGGVDEMIGSGHRLDSFIVHQCVDLEEEKKRFFSRMPRMVFRGVSKGDEKWQQFTGSRSASAQRAVGGMENAVSSSA